MTSLWLADRAEPSRQFSAADEDPSADVVVVGAGITGMVTAVLLARAGKKVLVIESRSLGAGATGNTTGKISLLQGTQMSKIAAKHGVEGARAYLQGNREGMEWVLRHCDVHGVAVQREDAYTYAQSEQGVSAIQKELAACQQVGLEAEWDDDPSVPFPYCGGVRLRDQAQFDPISFLDSLFDELVDHGGRLVSGVRVQQVSSGSGGLRLHCRATASESIEIHAQQCVLATGIPILDRGGFFARVKANRSYCLSFEVPGPITRGMFISSDSPTRSVRYAPTGDGAEQLIVGGAGHPVGRGSGEMTGVEELSSWARVHYPGAVATHQWSAQDYAPIDALPYVGPLLPGYDKIFVATGFDKWGMTNGPAAALALSARILGGRMDWASAFASWSPHELSGLATAVQSNMEVGFHLAKGWVAPAARAGSPPEEGGGVVSGPPWHLQACSMVDGVKHRVSPVCPHLGGIVHWNDADKAWECPLHGSRFAPDGTLLEGPATRDLTASPEGARS